MRPFVKGRRFEADAADQEVFPLAGGHSLAATGQIADNVSFGELDRPEVGDGERSAALALAGAGAVLELDLAVEPAGQHPFVLVDHLGRDVDIVEEEGRDGGHECVGARVKPGRDQVDHLDRALLASPGFEEFVLAGTNDSFGELPLDDGEAFADLGLVSGRTIFADQKLGDVGRNRVAAAKLLGEVFTDHVSFKRRRYL